MPTYIEGLEKHIELLESQLAEAQQQLVQAYKQVDDITRSQPPCSVIISYRDGSNGLIRHNIDAAVALQDEQILVHVWRQIKYELSMRYEIQKPLYYKIPVPTPFPTIGNGI
jgi:hypothetical protein